MQIAWADHIVIVHREEHQTRWVIFRVCVIENNYNEGKLLDTETHRGLQLIEIKIGDTSLEYIVVRRRNELFDWFVNTRYIDCGW